MLVERCGESEHAGVALGKLLRAGVDGVVLPPPLCEAPLLLAEVMQSGAVAVAVAPGHPSEQIATIRIDNEAAAYELTEYLLALGHRRFGFIKGHPNQTVSEQRLAGFLAAIAAAGIAQESLRVEQGYFTYRSGLDAAERILSVSYTHLRCHRAEGAERPQCADREGRCTRPQRAPHCRSQQGHGILFALVSRRFAFHCSHR